MLPFFMLEIGGDWRRTKPKMTEWVEKIGQKWLVVTRRPSRTAAQGVSGQSGHRRLGGAGGWSIRAEPQAQRHIYQPSLYTRWRVAHTIRDRGTRANLGKIVK
jgi:hypothetical protein